MSSPALPPSLPPGITVDDRGHEIEITWRWLQPGDLPGMVLWVALFVLLLIVFPGAIVVFAIIGVIGGLLLLSQLLNRSKVVANAEQLEVSNGPLTRSRRSAFQSDDLTQIYVVQNQLDAFNGSRVNAYEVHAVTKSSEKDHMLIGNITELEQALHIEGELERFLEITDIDVPGSISRSTGRAVPKEQVLTSLDWDGHIIEGSLIDPASNPDVE